MKKYSTPIYEKNDVSSQDVIALSFDWIIEEEDDGVKITHSADNIFG